jgi:outer membrane protein TolC
MIHRVFICQFLYWNFSMLRILPILGLILALRCGAYAQPPTPTPGLVLTLTLQEALERAETYSQQLLSANIAARIAREDRVQAKAALLPSVNWENGFIYTQPNGTDTGVFVTNNGPRVYTNMANVHADVYAPGRRADYQMSIAAEAVARAKVEIAARGLTAVVVQNFYGMAVAQRHYNNARRSLQEAEQFVDITQKQEAGGEAAHSDVVKAQLTLDQRIRDVQDAQLAYDKARIGFAFFLFPDFRQDYTVADDLDRLTPLAAFPEIASLAQRNNPDIRVAQSTVTQETFGIQSARSGLLPTFSVDYFYGLNSNQYTLHNELGHNNLGSSVVASLNVPVWNWGAARSKVKQAELRLQQARVDLSFTQRQLLSSLNSFYLEANVASRQMASLKHSLDLAEESLKLTLLRYEAGEVTVLEVVDAQTTLLSARNAYDDGLARYRLALAALQTLTGAF